MEKCKGKKKGEGEEGNKEGMKEKCEGKGEEENKKDG